MVKNSDKFIESFVKIEMYLKKYLQSPKIGFVQMIHTAAKTNPIVKRHVAELIEFSQLRNAIVHNRAGEEVAIAEPHDSICIEIEKISKSLESPILIHTLFKSSKIYITDLSMSLKDLLEAQNSNNYSVVPVYDRTIYVGLVHPRSYQKLLQHYSDASIDLSKLSVKDILKAHPDDDRVVFESSNSSVFTVLQRFITQQEKGRGLIAVLITQNGKPNEKLLGILTAADLPRMMAALE